MKFLLPGERVISAHAEPADGPGWSNQAVWVVYRDKNNKLREFAIQPNDQTPGMHALYRISAEVHRQMKAEVERMMVKP